MAWALARALRARARPFELGANARTARAYVAATQHDSANNSHNNNNDDNDTNDNDNDNDNNDNDNNSSTTKNNNNDNNCCSNGLKMAP